MTAELSFRQGLTAQKVSGQILRATLQRLGIRWQRASQWITSPDLSALLPSLKGLITSSRSTELTDLQQFFNSDLGLPYVPPGGCLTVQDLDACCRPGLGLSSTGTNCDMGVEVGQQLHMVIRQRGENSQQRPLLAALVLRSFEELNPLMRQYDVASCVIDAQPEQHKALEFARKHRREVRLSWYDRTKGEHHWEQEGEVYANRTHALDETFTRSREGEDLLPENGRELVPPIEGGHGEYYRQLMAPIRVIREGPDGNPTSKYDSRGKPDHFAHAEAYCTLASLAPRRYVRHTYLSV